MLKKILEFFKDIEPEDIDKKLSTRDKIWLVILAIIDAFGAMAFILLLLSFFL